MIKCKKVSAIDLFYLILWGIIFFPPIVSHFSSFLANIAICFGFVLFLLLFITYDGRITYWKEVWSLFLFIIWCIGITLIKSPNKLFSLMLNSVLPIIEFFFLAQCSINSKQNRSFKALYNVCKFYIIINFLSMLLWPQGIFRSSVGSSVNRAQWIFGSKNNVALYMIIFIVIVAWYIFCYEKNQKKVVIYAMMAVFSVVMCGENGIGLLAGSATGIVAILVTLFLIYYGYFTNNTELFSISNRTFLIISAIIYLVILSGGMFPFFEDLIVNIFHKTLTYSGRTSIWKTTMLHILDSMWTGHGEVDFYSIVYIEHQLTYTTYTYNVALKIILNYGIIGLCLLMTTIFIIPSQNKTQCKLLFSGLIGLLVVGLMNELDIKWILFFPVLICYAGNIRLENSQTDGKKKKVRIKF